MRNPPTIEPQAHLAAIIKSTDDAIVSKDLTGVILSWNPAAERIFGFTPAEAIGKSIHIIIPDDRRAEELEVLAKVSSGEGVDHYETVRQRKDGTLIDISLTVSPIRDSTGRIVGASKVARDITERKRLAEAVHSQLMRERTFQTEANRIKDQFLATLSHELRTPLNAIIGWAEMLLAGTLSEPEKELGLKTIERNARAQVQLVDDLLDVGRITSGKMRLQIQSVDLVEVAKNAMDIVRPSATAKKIKLIGEWKRPELVIEGDEDRLQQVAWNLLSNAIKFTPARGQVTVRVEPDSEGNACLTVQDSGAGIGERFLPHVFDRFRQQDGSLTRRHGGLGLGLAIVRQIVELHGGTVDVESPGEQKGSTFTVVLPGATSRRKTPAVIPDQAFSEPRLEGLRILVVDDHADDRELLAVILRREEAEVRLVATAAEALEALQSWKPDVLVSDIEIPEEDGYMLIAKVRELADAVVASTPAIAVTAHARIADRQRAIAAGYEYHIAKPIDRMRLIDAVGAAAGRRLQRPKSPARGTSN